jgi:beta-mannanase
VPAIGSAAHSTAPPTSTSKLRLGVAISGADGTNSALDELALRLRESPSIVMVYKDFNQPPPLLELGGLEARGAVGMITWEPWTWGGGLDQPAYRSARIAAGDFDPYLVGWADALARWGGPVMIRYAQEMNIAQYPWSDRANGNADGDYAAAWRHIHDLFDAAGARNVQWVWSPNVPNSSSEPLAAAFPGLESIDYVALDGYNWGTTESWSSWTPPCALFGNGLAQVRDLAPGMPVLIAETGSVEDGGSKATWNRDLIDYLARQPDVAGVVFFNQNKEHDWRVNSSDSSLAALVEALATRTR